MRPMPESCVSERRPGATPAGRRSPAAVPGEKIGRATEGALGTPFTTECTTASATCALLLRKINAAYAKRPIVGVDSSVESLASPGGSSSVLTPSRSTRMRSRLGSPQRGLTDVLGCR